MPTYNNILEFMSKKPDMAELKRQYSHRLQNPNLLTGEFVSDIPNRYPSDPNVTPLVVSWIIEQGLNGDRKNPTFGMFTEGRHNFPLGEFAERITPLEGRLGIKINDDEIFPALPGKSYTIPASSRALFDAFTGPVLYLCQYSKDGNFDVTSMPVKPDTPQPIA